MRFSQDILVCETGKEFMSYMNFQPRTAFQRGKHVEYIDVT